MAIVTLNTIKNWFKTGLKPTQAQFWDVWDSFRHKSVKVPYDDIEGLAAVLLAQDERIDQISLPDTVIKEGNIYITDRNIVIPVEDFSWRLLQVEYTNALIYMGVLPTATNDYSRTDIFVGTNLGTIYRVQGEERIGIAFKPNVPVGTIELGYVDIEGATVSTPIIIKSRVPVSSVNGKTGAVVMGIDDIAGLQGKIDLKLDAADYNQHFKGVYLTEAALNSALLTASIGDYAQVNEVGATDVVNYNWDDEESIWVKNVTSGGSGAANTDELPEGSTNLYYTVTRFLADLTFARVVAALGYTPSTAPNDAQKNSDITKAEIESKFNVELGFACSDETTNLATGLVTTFRMPYAMTLANVRISLTTAPTISTVIVDIKQGGTSIFSTLVSIDANELTSTTAATPAVILTTALIDDSLMTIHITQIGSGDTGKGLKVLLIGKKS